MSAKGGGRNDIDESRRQRSETSIQIRKEKREEQLNRRRRTGGTAGETNSFGTSGGMNNLPNLPTTGSSISKDMILEHRKNVFSGDPEAQLKSTTQFRKLEKTSERKSSK